MVAINYNALCGWQPTPLAEWPAMRQYFRPFTGPGLDKTDWKRTVAWDATAAVKCDFWRETQETGDCFVAGTLVTMADGSQKPIEQVQVGEFVRTHVLRSRQVLRTISKPYDGEVVRVRNELATTDSVWCTPDHKFFVNDLSSGEDWIPASELDQRGWGDIRHVIGRNYVNNGTVYCLEVDEDHSFLANGIAVSNCVSWGARKALECIMCWEIVRLGQPEKYRPLFAPWIYAISRCTPEGGRNQLRGGAGSRGTWVASTIKYGVLAADEPGVPKYSGRIADQWGDNRGWQDFQAIAVLHQFKTAAEMKSAADAADAINNGYFVTIAGNREYPNQLTNRNGKGWYGRGPRYPHQTSLLGFDVNPEPCFYDSNQWPQHAQGQSDGPDGGGWRTFDYIDREIKSGEVECFAFSMFDGFPGEAMKPDFSLGA